MTDYFRSKYGEMKGFSYNDNKFVFLPSNRLKRDWIIIFIVYCLFSFLAMAVELNQHNDLTFSNIITIGVFIISTALIALIIMLVILKKHKIIFNFQTQTMIVKKLFFTKIISFSQVQHMKYFFLRPRSENNKIKLQLKNSGYNQKNKFYSIGLFYYDYESNSVILDILKDIIQIVNKQELYNPETQHQKEFHQKLKKEMKEKLEKKDFTPLHTIFTICTTIGFLLLLIGCLSYVFLFLIRFSKLFWSTARMDWSRSYVESIFEFLFAAILLIGTLLILFVIVYIPIYSIFSAVKNYSTWLDAVNKIPHGIFIEIKIANGIGEKVISVLALIFYFMVGILTFTVPIILLYLNLLK